MAEVATDPHIAARNMIVEVEDPIAGPVKLAGCPIKMSAFPDPHRRATAPRLDGDRERILAELAAETENEP
jgi:CoA:oxalate CoA-transferase